ncbi:luciferase family protein [Enterovibrio sp. FF113]|uniref:luciferase domain-containing protein n=1 Tax=Enterovibrio sp. FF113 TaxID=3230010 RepID=UPI00352F10AC
MCTKKKISALFALFLSALFIGTAFAAELERLPARTSPVPATTNSVPHVQLGGESNPAFLAELMTRVSRVQGIEIRDTMISMPGASGFWVSEHLELANPQAIVGGREFAHMHPDGSLHASLSPTKASEAVNAGWATYHPWAKKRKGWEGFVMIYTPTTDAEVNVVYQLVLASFDYVTGQKLSSLK